MRTSDPVHHDFSRGRDASRASRALIPLILVLLVAAPSWATGSTWPCAASRVFKSGYSGTISIPTFATVYDTTIEDSHSARLAFDRLQRRATLSGTSSGRFEVALRVVECLDVLGVPAGTPLDATLEFDLEGWTTQQCGGSGCGVMLEASVVAGTDSASANANQVGPGAGWITPLDGTLSVPIHFVAGTPVTVQFVYRYGTGPGGGGARGEAAGVWRVTGLPAGVTAFGAAGTNLTPVRTASWGRIKTRYR